MIIVTSPKGEPLAINGELIERVEGDDESRIVLTTGARYIVAESLEEVVRLARHDRAEVLALSHRLTEGTADEVTSSLHLVAPGDGAEPEAGP